MARIMQMPYKNRQIIGIFALLAVMKRLFTVISLLFFAALSFAQQKVISFDKMVNDFGDILISDGPVSCSFAFKNISQKPIVIHQIASSCGCTTPTWTREPVMPGQSGKIDVTFTNDQGPYPFEKSLTVYVSGLDRPVVLKIKGQAFDRKKRIDEIYTIRMGPLGLRQDTFTIGYIDKGTAKSDETLIANLSSRPVKVDFTDLSQGLSVTVSPNPIPAGTAAKLKYSVDSRLMKADAWGRQTFRAGFLADGKKQSGNLTVTGVIKDNFDALTEEQIKNAGTPVVEKSYWEFGTIKPGTLVEASFQIRNKGSHPLVIHKVDTKSGAVKVLTKAPVTIKSGGVSTVKVQLDTKSLEGEVVEVLTLVTNAPSKPLVNLFITGIVNK